MMKAKCSSLASISKLSVTLIYFIPMLSKTLLRKPFKKGPPLDIMSFHTIGLHGSLWFEINATRHATRSRNGTFSSQNWLPSQQAVHDKIKNGISLQQQLTNTVHADIRGRERTKFSWLRKIFPPDDMMAIIRCLGCEYCRLRLFDRHKEAKALRQRRAILYISYSTRVRLQHHVDYALLFYQQQQSQYFYNIYI